MADFASTSLRRWFKDEHVFGAGITLLFLLAAIWNVWHHVLWRDEVRWWQLATASPNFSDMCRNMQFEGTPILWYGIIWILSRIFSSMFAMQMTHAVLAAGVVFVFAWRAPFGRIAKSLFPFGYFAYFEYATISRNYVLVFLFVLIGAAIISLSRPRPILLMIAMALLTQVSIWGAGLACLLTLTAIIRWSLMAPRHQRVSFGWWVLALTVVIGCCGLCYWESLPGPGPSFIAKWLPDTPASAKLMLTVGTVWKGWFPLPRWTRAWWNTNILDQHLYLEFYVSLILIVLAFFSLLNRPAGLLVFVGGMLGLMGFTFFAFVGVTRHAGHLFMVLIAACWIAQCSPRVDLKLPRLQRIVDWLDVHRTHFLLVILSVHVISGIGANIADNRLPFSGSKAAANYIRRELPPDIALAGLDDYCVAPTSVLLNRPVYSFQMRTTPIFFSQDDAVRQAVSLESMFDQILMLNVKTDKDVVLVFSSGRAFEQNELNVQFPPTTFGPPPVLHVSFLAKFDDSTVADEAETLYRVHRVQ